MSADCTFEWRASPVGAVLVRCHGAAGRVAVPGTALGLPVAAIGPGAFLNGARMTSVELPASLTTIGGSAFYGCENLREIDLPDGVSEIGLRAFQGCAALRRVSLPGRLTEIAPMVFYQCASLESMDVPDGVRAIGESAFSGCAALERVCLPEGLESIGEAAFAGCTALRCLRIPQSVTRMAASSVPPHLLADGGALYLPGQAMLVRAIASLEWAVPAGTRIIAARALAVNHDLTAIALPDSLERIGDYAFEDCRCLHRVRVPDGVSDIGPGAFARCAMLREALLPAGLKVISDSLFEQSGLASIRLPDAVETIGARAFADCAALEFISIGPAVRAIGRGAFMRCRKLRRLELPAGPLELGEGALGELSGLQALVLPGVVPAGLERALTDVRRVAIIAPNAAPEAFPPLWRRRVCLGLAQAMREGMPVSPAALEAGVRWMRAHSAALVSEAAANPALLGMMLDHRCFTATDARQLVDLLSRQQRPDDVASLLHYAGAPEGAAGPAEELW